MRFEWRGGCLVNYGRGRKEEEEFTSTQLNKTQPKNTFHYSRPLPPTAKPLVEARESLGCQGRPKLLREDRRSEAGAAGAVSVAESADECTSGASNELGLVTTPETVGARGSALG